MAEQRAQRRLSAILSADAVGYSRLMAADEIDTVHLIAEARQVMSDKVGQYGGRVVDATGDNVLAEFPSVVDAVQCAVEIQDELERSTAERPEERRMRFRIGVNLGDVVVEDERIYGDGVNVAARLEALAEPGGVCISGTAYDQVEGKLALGFEDAGEQTVKNIPKPVRVYRVRSGRGVANVAHTRSRRRTPRRRLHVVLATTVAILLLLGVGLWASWPRPLGLLIDIVGVSGPPVNPPLPDKPSIVVLPFVNISGDPEQEYFSDGITEEIITDLAGVPELFVISRNSAFTYKGRPVKVRDVGRDLGVRYVLEGTVRKAEGRVRITAQLIDATSDFHLWSERYDRELSDIFALQSDISQQILVALKVELRDAALERIVRESTRNLEAQDTLWRGWAHAQRFTWEDTLEARYLYERAIEQDPDSAVAYALAGSTYGIEYLMGWNVDPTLLDRAEELEQRALTLDPSIPTTHIVMALIHLRRGQLEEAVAAAERAVELGPNFEFPHLILGVALARRGRIVAAMQSLDRALRLNPKAPSATWGAVAYINFAAGRTEQAVELWEQVRAANTDGILPRISLAVLYESEGRHEEARVLAQEILRVNPDLTAESATELIPGLGLDADQAIDHLRRAGLP
ncbi:MAG: adenylate/guanylate cyclase domain-containing protein [Deltaproteobacteria bacterium]|nr:adenylate/guanylate cyclase domain-containing protein [Deltaproteobacteria bacterium]